MLSKHLQDRFSSIVIDAFKMVTSHIYKGDLATGINYASIYARSVEDFDNISRELKNNGVVALERQSGDYYRLEKPLSTPVATITHCRVRVFDNENTERGYTDF